MNYYNEWDKGAAAWLRELIKAGLIPNGYVDERSITEVSPGDLEGFTQCHFFAGIGGWPLALQLAGVDSSTHLWTGSPPCQPFSTAGKQLGFEDHRHLAPALLNLIAECRPTTLFGEQVAAAIGKHWLDFIVLELEAEGYTCGAAVLPAASVGAPHKRDRLFFGAVGNAAHIGLNRGGNAGTCGRDEYSDDGAARSLADTHDTGSQRWGGVPERADKQPAGSGRMDGGSANKNKGFWSGADWLGCRDGKIRPVEPGTFPLDHGISARVGRLRGYGNAIVPQVAAEFIKAFIKSI